MSYKVEIIEDTSSSLIEIQASINDQEPSLDVLQSNTINLSVSHDIALLPTDLNSLIDNRLQVFLISDPLLSTLVSGLVPVKNINGSGYININSSSGNFIISVTGLQPSGNYALLSGASFTGSILSPTGIFTSLRANSIDISGSLIAKSGHFYDSLKLNNIDVSVSGHSHNIGDVSGLQIALDNKQASGNYSLVGHSHSISNITDFTSGVTTIVSGSYAPLNSPSLTGIPLAPTASSGTNTNQIASTAFVRTEISNLVSSAPSTLDTLNELAAALGNDFNFSTTITNNLANKANLSGATFTGTISGPSGNFISLRQNGVMVSISGHSHIINDIGGLQTALDNKQPSGNYSLLGHMHTISDISGLQSSLDSKQPSGNYSSLIHNHQISDITNFGSGVSGLLPIKNITSGSGINVISSSGNFTIAVTGNFGLTSEEVDDRVYSLLSAGTGIVLNYDDPNNILQISTSGLAFTSGANFNSLSIIGVPVSISGHKHVYTDITNFSSGVQDNLTTTLLPGSFININYDSVLDTLTVSASGLQPSGNYSISGHAHTVSDLTNFGSGVSGLLPVKNIIGGGYVNVISTTGLYTIGVSGLQSSGNYSLVGHSHSISDVSGLQVVLDSKQPSGSYANLSHTHLIADVSGLQTSLDSKQPSGSYASSSHSHIISDVSGLQLALDEKQPSGNYASLSHAHTINDVSGLQTALDNKQPSGNYAQSSHTHTSSQITDFNSSVSGLLSVKNISAGYDISISNVSGNYTIASTNLVHVDSKQPQGFINRNDSRISVSGNIFTIAPTGSSYSFYNQGIKVIKTSGDSLTIPNLTQINYIHFDTINNQLSNKTTGFDFRTDIPIAYVAWNSGVGPSGQMTFFAEERHGIVMDTSTHKWIHNTFGAQYVDGLSISNYVLGGNGTSNSHATISIGNGTLYQEDIEINITDSSSTDPFCQELSPIAQIPVYYHEGSTGQWVKNTATDYPVKYGANGPQYNLLTGGTWTIPDVSPGGATRCFAVWILATNQIDDPIISIMGQRIDSNQGSAESNNSWSDVNLTNLPLSEVKPLYRLIFAGDSDYTNVPKCSLLSILDIRVAVISTIAGVSQNDHGSLFGLGDDDHSQYLHTDNNRTVNATHNFVNGLTSNGLIDSTSGNFGSLSVNNINVSISGHTHSSSNITDFNSSVSGLLPVKNIVAGSNVTVSSASGNYTINRPLDVYEYLSSSGLPVLGNSSTIYIVSDTNKTYRWDGSFYVEIGSIGGGTGKSLGFILSLN